MLERIGLQQEKLNARLHLVRDLTARRRTGATDQTKIMGAPALRSLEALKFWLGLPNSLYQSDWNWRES